MKPKKIRTRDIITIAVLIMAVVGIITAVLLPDKEKENSFSSADAEIMSASQWQEISAIVNQMEETDDFTDITSGRPVFDFTEIPEYSGSAYVYVNGNVPFFTEEEITTDSFEIYSPLDELGRCGSAFANICTDTLPTEERGDISSVYPTGWVQEKYEGVDQGWLYNRCHLIAYSLAGENANERNLITGTRYMNIEGMWQMEETVLNYVRENPDNHILYRVTPVFEGDNLLASGVLMEAYSVEDNGEVSFCVYCYNVQPDVSINYVTGESYKN